MRTFDHSSSAPRQITWWYGSNVADALAAGRHMLTAPDGRVGVIVPVSPQPSVGDYVTAPGVTQALQLRLMIGRVGGTHELWLCGAPWNSNVRGVR